jgi:hypothetical protein
MRNLTSVASSPNDGPDKTLARILESVSGVNPSWTEIDLSNYSGANPGTVVYKIGSSTVLTLTLSYDGSGNLTSVVRS